ncbi:MAG: LPS assembly lipoprotein LptE [Pseudomonadota bacterium]
MWWSDRLQIVSLALVASVLVGCGYAPMYGSGTPARSGLGEIYVDLIPTESGYTLRNALIDQIGPAATPTHRLEVDLDIDTEGVVLTTQNVTTRFDVRGTASFELLPIEGGAPVLRDTVEALAGYSAPDTQTSSAFASRVAERDAINRVSRQLAQRIALRIAIHADDWVTDASPQSTP